MLTRRKLIIIDYYTDAQKEYYEKKSTEILPELKPERIKTIEEIVSVETEYIKEHLKK